MDRPDLDRALYPLALTVGRRLFAALIAAVVLSFAESAIDGFSPDESEVMTELTLWLAVFGLAMAIVAEMVVAIPVYRLMLADFSPSPWSVWSRRGAARLAVYFTAIAVFFVANVLVGAVLWYISVGIFGPWLGAGFEGLGFFFALTITSIPLNILFGLTFADIVATGRFRPGFALRWGSRKFRRLLVLLCAGSLPMMIAGDVVTRFDQSIDAARTFVGTWPTVPPETLALLVVEGILWSVTSLFGALALAKVYREAVIAEGQAEAGRVAEVFH